MLSSTPLTKSIGPSELSASSSKGAITAAEGKPSPASPENP